MQAIAIQFLSPTIAIILISPTKKTLILTLSQNQQINYQDSSKN